MYRDFVLKNRNDLTEKFREVREDLKDCMIDVPVAPKFPMAVLFQHGSDYLSLTTRPARVSLGFFMRKSDERVESFFKKDLYQVCTLPDQTSCIVGETPFKLDLPLSYGMVVFKVHAAILAFRAKAKLPIESNACCLELYF